MNLKTALLGDPYGDTGVYVWNLWIFGHELLTHGRLPFSTDHIFAYSGPVDLSLHNYTPLAGLLGTTLVPWLGVVGAFNLLTIGSLVTSGLGTGALARQLGLSRTSAWSVGALFMAAPLVTARETAHMSLITTAPLVLFVWALLRVVERPGIGRGVLVGCLVAASTYSDAYYGVFCILIGAFVLAWRYLRVEYCPSLVAPSLAYRGVNVLLVTIAAGVTVRLVTGPVVLEAGSLRVTFDTFFTPALAVVVLGALGMLMRWRPSIRIEKIATEVPSLVLPGTLAVGTCLALLSPLLIGVADRYLQGRLPGTVTYWRSSPRGVDLFAYLVPNPSHPLFGAWTERWLLPDGADAFPEYVASFSLVALGLIAWTAWRRALPRQWIAFTAFFALLSLGPFVYFAGVNTYIIAPWALLRYLPIVGMARTPARFSIVAALGFSILFGFALDAWRSRDRRRLLRTAVPVALLVALEVLPAPRRLYSAQLPDVYRSIAFRDAEPGNVLELPTGIRDGTSSLGDFSAATQFFQTGHGHGLVGGYLSRVSEWRKQESLRSPVLQALYALSAGPGALSEEVTQLARQSRDSFLGRTCVRYVVIDTLRASRELRDFAFDVLELTPIRSDGRYELLAPQSPPKCDAVASEPRPWEARTSMAGTP